MTTTEPTTVGTTDALQRVHHHCPEHLCDVAMEGLAVPSLCGYVKTIDREAAAKPCCPLCAADLASRGRRCSGVPLSHREGGAA